MATTGGIPVHQSQHIGYRVYIHRLRLGGQFNIPGKGNLDIDTILNLDYSDPLYPVISDYLNNTAVFQKFLAAIKKEINTGLSASLDVLSSGNGIFQTIDITPLVQSYSVALSIDDTPACTLNLIDFNLQDFDSRNTEYFSKAYPKWLSGDSRADDATGKGLFDGLRKLIIREFDFIRIMGYSKTSTSTPGSQIRKDSQSPELADRINYFSSFTGFFGDKDYLDPYYAMRPQFTGVVASVTRSSSADGSPGISVGCLGISRALTQSVVVFDQAITNVFSIDAGDPNIDPIKQSLSVFGNIFQNKSSEQVFEEIIRAYFRPIWLTGDANFGKDKLGVIAIPTIKPSYWDSMLQNGDNPGSLTIIPYIQTTLTLHILKTLRGEPIATKDDRMDKSRRMNGPHPTLERKDYNLWLTPYLTMIKESYQTYDASYVAPNEVFGEIRNKTYYEIFEDRCGTFHLRFPKYNSCLITHACTPENTISVSCTKEDSGIYNVTLTNNMMSYYGVIDGVAGNPFVDRLSILKSGFRAPQVVENPISVDNYFAKILAKFIREYTASKSSRRAEIKKLVDLSINVGDQVVFGIGPTDKMAGSGVAYGGADDDLFVGYVTGINETVSVNGSNEQTLNLSFVRPVKNLTRNGIQDLISADVYSLSEKISVPELGASEKIKDAVKKSNLPTIEQISKISNSYVSGKSQNPEDYFSVNVLTPTPGDKPLYSSVFCADFRAVLDPLVLAKNAPARKPAKTQAMLRPAKGKTIADYDANIESLNNTVQRHGEKLALNAFISKNFYSELLKKMQEQTLSEQLVGGVNLSSKTAVPENDPQKIYEVTRAYLLKFDSALTKAQANNSYLRLRFPNDPVTLGTRSYQINGKMMIVDDSGIINDSKNLISKAYANTTTDLAEQIVADYKKYFNPGPPQILGAKGEAPRRYAQYIAKSYTVQRYTKEDARRVNLIINILRDWILPSLISSLSLESQQKDAEIQSEIQLLNEAITARNNYVVAPPVDELIRRSQAPLVFNDIRNQNPQIISVVPQLSSEQTVKNTSETDGLSGSLDAVKQFMFPDSTFNSEGFNQS